MSHEAIYPPPFAQARGALERELTKSLRTGRAMRFPRGARTRAGRGRGPLVGTVSIRERPAEVDDRAVPGRWEGGLVFGRHHPAVGTLVERTTRYLLLPPVPGGYKGGPMRAALAGAVTRLPEQPRRSLTWAHGRAMGGHVRCTVDSGVPGYFCDPRSPWQRGTHGNTNGLPRRYLPKGADLKPLAQADLDAVAAEPHGRPRETLGRRSPAERFPELAEAG